jgi:hypothetical protein
VSALYRNPQYIHILLIYRFAQHVAAFSTRAAWPPIVRTDLPSF